MFEECHATVRTAAAAKHKTLQVGSPPCTGKEAAAVTGSSQVLTIHRYIVHEEFVHFLFVCT